MGRRLHVGGWASVGVSQVHLMYAAVCVRPRVTPSPLEHPLHVPPHGNTVKCSASCAAPHTQPPSGWSRVCARGDGAQIFATGHHVLRALAAWECASWSITN